jgi:hypothetical protein
MNPKILSLAAGLLLAASLYSQQPEPSFLYLLDWGEGGVNTVNYKVDAVIGIDPLEDGYIFKLSAFCENATIFSCVRYAKISFLCDIIWQTDFVNPDTNFLTHPGKVEDWILNNQLYSLAGYAYSQDSINYFFSVFNIDDGSLFFARHYPLYSIDSIYNGESFLSVNDSLLLLAGSYPALPYKLVPALRWIRRSDGALVKSVNVMDVFNNNSNKLESLTLRSDGNFNFSFVRRPVYDDAAGFLYAGVVDTAGNVLSLHFTGDHTGFHFPALPPMTQEVVLPSGNRFLVSGIDTTLNDELAISNLFKTYLLDEDGAVIKDSLFHIPGDTIYRVTDLDLAENGEVLVAGELFNWGATDKNNKEIFLMRYSAQGELLWHKTYAPFFFHHYANRVFVHQVEEDIDGGILITGHVIRSLDTVQTSSNRERYAFILKVDSDGCYFNNCEGGFILTDVSEAPIIDLTAPLRVFPNPAADELNLQFFRPVHGAIRIYDAMGRLHWSGASNGAPDQQISLGNWPPGLYLLQLEEEGRRYTVKFVKM